VAEKGTAMYEYRNIDTDAKLLKFARRYHTEDITIDQLEYVAGLEGYSKREIERAIYDYYLIHIRPEELMKNYVLPIGLALFLLLMLIKLLNDRGIW
jgi:hypothetical protein